MPFLPETVIPQVLAVRSHGGKAMRIVQHQKKHEEVEFEQKEDKSWLKSGIFTTN